jgi:hypothetical protein
MSDRTITTPEQVVAELRAMSAQIIHPKDTYLSSMADVVERLEASRKHRETEAIQCAAMRDALLNRLQWSNVNGRGAFILKGVDQYTLGSLMVDTANKAKQEQQ